MDTLMQDVRVAIRRLAREKGFTSVVTLTLALAIGVNTIVFSFLNFFVLRPLPVKEPETLVRIWSTHPEQGVRGFIPYRDFLEWRDNARSFAGFAATGGRTYNLTGLREPVRVQGWAVSASFFELWGLPAVRGRTILPDEDRPGAGRTVLLSHGFWQRQLGASEDVVGKTLRLDGVPYTVVGVLTPAIEIGDLTRIDIWTPLAAERTPDELDVRDLSVTARLKPGITLEQGTAELRAIAARLARERPDTHAGWGVHALLFRRSMAGADAWVILALMSVAVSFVLAIACANVANLMLARAAARERETAVRLALGAGRGRLVRELLTEGVVLAVFGGGVGLLIAQWGLAVIRSVTFEPFFQVVTIDGRVLSLSLLTAILSPLLFGLGPALQSARAGALALKEWGAGAIGSRRGARLRNALVILQLTLAMSLLVISGLAIRASMARHHLDFGFDHRDLAVFRVDLPASRFGDDAAVRGFFTSLVERIAALPGAQAAGAATAVPVIDNPRLVPLTVEGVPPAEGASPVAARIVATPTFLPTLGIPLLSGRSLDARDTAGAEPTVVVSRALVARHFAGRPALGARIRLGPPESSEPWRTIVGVVGDVHNGDVVDPPLPHAYIPFLQRPERALAIFVRTKDARGVLAAARAELARIDPEQPLYSASTIEQIFFEETASNRVVTGLFVAFALVALGMGAVGLYGVIAYAVNRRTREIGLRMALGAAPRDVVRMVLHQGARLTLVGLGLGLVVGLALARAIAGVLYGVGPTDPWTYSGVVFVLTTSALLASWIPARRASHVDPLAALRTE